MNIRELFDFFKKNSEEEDKPLKEIIPILKQKLIDAHQKKETIIFKIIKAKKTGFLVKVKGLFAFVPFSLMAWDYPFPIWKIMENELINYKFFAKITEIDLTTKRIILNAKVTEFNSFELIDGNIYSCIILNKQKDYIIVELGHRFHWKYGSQCFMVRLDSPNYSEIDYSIHSISDEITLTYVNSAHNWKKISFSKNQLKPQSLKKKQQPKTTKDKSEHLEEELEKIKKILEKKKNKNKTLQKDYTKIIDLRKEEKQTNLNLQEKIKNQAKLIYYLENQLDLSNLKAKRLTTQLNKAINTNSTKKNIELETQISNLNEELKQLKLLNKKLEKQLEDSKEIVATQETLIYYLKNGANK